MPRIGKVLVSISNYKEGKKEGKKEEKQRKNKNLITVFIMSGKDGQWKKAVGKRPSLKGPESQPKLVLTLRDLRVRHTRMNAFL